MLTEAKNTIKVIFLSFKYNMMKEMVNKFTFFANIIFMMINNSSFLAMWGLIFNIKSDIAGIGFNDVLLIWGMSSFSFGVAHCMFRRAFWICDEIVEGKLDTYLVQPKNVLLMVITSSVEVSAIGDMIYGIVLAFVLKLSFLQFLRFIFMGICGGMISIAFAIILQSLSFYIPRSEALSTSFESMLGQTSTYPQQIFSKGIQLILYSIIPTGFHIYLPVKIVMNFDIKYVLIEIIMTSVYTFLAFFVFNKGLKHYASNNLMASRV